MDAGMPQSGFGDWDFWSQGLDKAFFTRVYKRATQIAVVVALMFLAFDKKDIAVGVLAGLGVGLFSTWTVEATVRLLFRGGTNAGLKLAMAAFVKMPMLLAILLPVAWACFNKYMNAFAVVGGLVLVHASMLVMVIGTAMAEQDRNRERYR
jgi:hypothetical protein